MFGLLKNKLSGFIRNLVGKEEKKEARLTADEGKNEQPAQALALQQKGQTEHSAAESQEQKQAAAPSSAKMQASPFVQAPLQPPQPEAREAPELKSAQKKEARAQENKKQASIRDFGEKPIAKERPASPPASQKQKEETPRISSKPAVPAPEVLKQEQRTSAPPKLAASADQPILPKMPEHDISGLERKAATGHRGMAPKIGLGTAIRSFFSNEITIGEAEVADLLEELELSLLEADVAYDVSLEVSQKLRDRLVGMRVPKGEIEKRAREAIGQTLESVMDSERKFDLIDRVKSLERPVKILFVGPNGAGKTTTIAKIARKLMDSGLSVVFSASDTFRAAAIEQTEVHAERLGVKVVKSKYGADPASVAFDAVNHARSNGIDVVLIDSAGRQDTNANLLSELKKINRVAKPDLKLYVGESIGGNALLEQIRAFNEAIGIDGAILTKIDCDAKGGTAISISRSTGIPIIYLGTGQRYEDLIPFDAHRVAQEIMAG